MTTMPFFGPSPAMPFPMWPAMAPGMTAYMEATRAAWTLAMQMWSPWMSPAAVWQQPAMMPWAAFANPWFAQTAASLWLSALKATPWSMLTSAAPSLAPAAFRSAGGFAMAPAVNVWPGMSRGTTFDALLQPAQMWSFAWTPLWPAHRR